jgi:hypothetical protein
MTIAFYGFQRVPDVRHVTPERRWRGWFEDDAVPMIRHGIKDLHLHNPFGLHEVAGRGRLMHIDQFQLSYCQKELRWLADRASIRRVVRDIDELGGKVSAFVGSRLVIRQPPQAEYLPRCAPGARALSTQVRMLNLLGACVPPLTRGCLCWGRPVGFHISALVDAGIDAIGFDASPDFRPGDCMDRVVRSLLDRRLEVMIEPWPRKDREYPRVNWIVREILYQRISFGLRPDAALESVRGKIYRIVPSSREAEEEEEFDELEEINALREKFKQPKFNSVQEVVDDVRASGHVPMVRAAQLTSGKVT